MEQKKHHDPVWLKEQIEAERSTRDIANELRISYKLVEILLDKNGIAYRSGKPSAQ